MTLPVGSTLASSVVIDASAWISRILPFDSNHSAAHRWINHHIAEGGSLIAPALFAVEIAAGIVRATQSEQIAGNALSELYLFSYLRLLPMDQALTDDAADVAIQFRLRGADSFYVAVAHQLKLPLVTFDNEQLTRPASIITTIRP